MSGRSSRSLWLSAADRARLAAIVADRNSPQKHVWRARIVLLSADRLGTVEIMRRTGKAKPSVWRWQARYLEAGVDGLLRDKTRPLAHSAAGDRPGRAGGCAAPCGRPPGEATHWTVRAMAQAAGISPASVQRIWAAHGLQPHRVRTFKLSTDPAFAAKLRDVVGLYVDPPAHAVVLSVDEKSQIQALDRTQPGLPMKKGRAGTMTHDYKRNGTTTLFAALNVLDGSVIGQCMQRHRHQEFIRFLNRDRARRPGRQADPRRSSTTTPPTSTPRSAPGSSATTAGPSTTPRPRLLAECRRGLLRQAHPAAPAARRLPLARRPPGRDQPLPRRAQPSTQAVRLDRRAGRDPGQGQTWASNVRDDPLVDKI